MERMLSALKPYVAVFTLELFLFAQIPLPLAAQGAGAAQGMRPAGQTGRTGQAADSRDDASSEETENRRDGSASAQEAPSFASLELFPGSGGTIELDGVRVEVPGGAVEKPTVIRISRLADTQPLADGLANVTKGARGYRLEPHGTRFTSVVFLSMPFERELLDSPVALSNLFTYFYDESAGRWERLQRISLDREKARITSLTNHFTDVINATLTLPEGPSPILFDVNSIKNLEAANPAAGVPTPEGLTPGPYGSAAFRIPLRLPKGRGGATPELSLRYNSDSANSWLGKGFDIEVPAITIDTRMGLPRYEGADRYSLEGEDLVFVGNEDGALRFRPRTERSFARILWRRGGGEDYWEVTDKSGGVREYGRQEGWIGPNRGNRTQTFSWYLTKARDVFGNYAEYSYAYDAPNAHTYLSDILYSGFEGSGGSYRIHFELEDRADRRMDSRGMFVSKLARRLSRISEYYRGSPIRSYLFNYVANQFGQSQLVSFTETDASGAAFYTYSFDYYALPEVRDGEGTLIGYQGFGDNEVTWGGTGSSFEPYLNESINLSAGGSLSLGLEISIRFLWWEKVIARIGARAGVDFSEGYTRNTLLDINGDGLEDTVWREGGALRGYLNTGSGFDTQNPFVLAGMNGKIDEESQTGFNIGWSAGLGYLGGAKSLQYTWPEAKTGFADVNGDGFVDFLKTGSSSFALNTGSSFLSTPLRFGEGAGTGPGEAVDPVEKDEFEKGYYKQEPLRRWKAYRSGTVEVRQEGHFISPNPSQDGVRLVTHAEDKTVEIPLTIGEPQKQRTDSFDAREGRRLNFRLDAKDQEAGDEVEWNVKIRYTAVKLWEAMESIAEFQPPGRSDYTYPFSDDDLEPIYDMHTQSTESGFYNYWVLKDDWWTLNPEILAPVYTALTEHRTFVPIRISRDRFDRLIAACDDENNIPVQDPEYPDDPQKKLFISELQALQSGYRYEPDTQTFLRVSSAGDEYIKKYLTLLLNAGETLSDLTHYRLLGRYPVMTQGGGGERTCPRNAPPTVISPEIFGEAQGVALGSTVAGKGILLDRMRPAGGDESTEEILWLRSDPDAGWRLFREDQTGEREETGASLSVFSPTLDSLSVSLLDRGVRRSFTLNGKTHLLSKLPESIYSGTLSDHILRHERFSTNGCSSIPEASWPQVLAGLSDEEKLLIEAAYTLIGGEYRLLESVSEEDFQKVQALAERSSDGVAGTLFDQYPADPQGTKRFILLEAGEYASFIALDAAALSPCFSSFTDGGLTKYYLKRNLSEAQRNTLHQAMSRYRRDAELFPYFDLQGQIRVLKTGANETAVRSAMSACGLYAYGALTRSITYSSQSLLDVEPGILPEGAVEEAFAPLGGMAARPAGSQTGVVTIPVFDGAGNTVLERHYIRIWDSAADYSPLDLMNYSEEPREFNHGNEPFGGGVQGWFYGTWVGYHPWDENRLMVQEEGEEQEDAIPDQPLPPPYYLAMNPNANGGGGLSIATEASLGQPVPADAWVGKVSSYSEPSWDDSEATSFKSSSFAATIHGDTLHPNRNGGDAYSRIPRSQPIAEGGRLGSIRNSRSKTRDFSGNASIPGAGVNGGSNNGNSWQYRGLMDINGDRYPDLVCFNDSQGGGGSFTVSPGNGLGFSASLAYATPFSHLGYHVNNSIGVGASVGPTKEAIVTTYESDGTVKAQKVKVPAPGFGGGIHGSGGSSILTESFLDINGDGLPDHVSRSGYGGYSVALNTGTPSFSFSTINWGSGMSGLSRSTEGICATATGSLGASVGASAGGVGFGAGISGGYTGTVNHTYSSLMDVNGDGLPDQVAKLDGEGWFRVRFNLGDCFSTQEVRLYRPEWGGNTDLRNLIAEDIGTISHHMGGLDLPGGFGLPGFGGSLPSQPSQLFGYPDPFSLADVLEYSSGASINLGANITFEFDFWLISLSISPGVDGSVATTSSTIKFTDINGDGLPDHVMKFANEPLLRVKLNAAGRVGLLRSVNLPMGGRYELEYARAGNTVDMPHNRWVLSRLTKDDGLTDLAPDRGEHRYSTSFSYSDGYYDRADRQFWGFGEVTSTFADTSRLEVRYANRDCHTRGMETGRSLYRSAGGGSSELLNETRLEIAELFPREYGGVEVTFPAVLSRTDRLYQEGTGSFTESRKRFGYEAYGNLSDLQDDGDTAKTGDEVSAHIVYYSTLPGYLRQHPESIRVEDAGGALLRLREGEYGSRGQLLRLHQYESATSSRTWELEWDPYGNLGAITDPRGMRRSWEYDGTLHTYLSVSRSSNPRMGGPAYVSRSSWDYLLGVETQRTDVCEETMRFLYDGFGRLTGARSPYDTGSVPAVAHQYLTSSFPWRALTFNKLRYDPADAETLSTLLSIDGLGRALQTAKEGEVWRDSRRTGWNLSGAVVYDAKARAIAEGQPEFAGGEELPGLASLRRPIQKTYDAMDRVTGVRLPDDALTTVSYLIRDGLQVERSVDPRGNISERSMDARGNTVGVRRLDSSQTLLSSVTYLYSVLGEILEVTDRAGNTVKTSFDLMGRRVRLESPDAGIVEYAYDESGNLKRKVDSVMRSQGESIEYIYDGHNRLIRTIYPGNPAVTYTYGDPGVSNHGAGRLIARQDESGSVSMQYGRLGETVGMQRSIDRLTPLTSPQSASFSYLSDYLGRMQSITYPDGETVSYDYDRGGQVRSVTGVHYGRETHYVSDIGYDEYGQRVFISYGNGVSTSYTYDENRRWLSSIRTTSPWGQVYQDMRYSFDQVGNVSALSNAASLYGTSASYQYDALYRLTSATATMQSRPHGIVDYTSTYAQSFGFDAIGNLSAKQSTVRTIPQKTVGDPIEYALDYAYYAGKAHQAERIGGLWYLYDENGNMIEERQGGHSQIPGSSVHLTHIDDETRAVNRGFALLRHGHQDQGVYARYYYWDEENRLKQSVEGELTVDYRYGADGQRALKYSSRGETLYFDSMWQATTDSPSLRRSKHVYVGQTRVATRCNIQDQPDAGYEETNTFYYHSDHLGSAQLVSRSDGNQYEHREYTPYGESWIEERSEPESMVPFRFTGKEQDPETGLYYYGARYLNPKTSMWLSADLGMESYLPVAPISDEARKHNANLPGMGGVFNPVNLVAYHYAGNNPLKLVDSDGNADFYCWMIWIQNSTNRDYGADQIRAAVSSVYNGDYFSAGMSGASAIIECVTDVLDNDIASVTGISPLFVLNRMARRAGYIQRQSAMLADDVGYNISPESWFTKYDTLGKKGTFLTDRKAITDELGDFKLGSQKLPPEQTRALEKALGLEPDSLSNGFRITEVRGISGMHPRSPLIGNDYFLGPGIGLPGGGPEIIVDPIPTGRKHD